MESLDLRTTDQADSSWKSKVISSASEPELFFYTITINCTSYSTDSLSKGLIAISGILLFVIWTILSTHAKFVSLQKFCFTKKKIFYLHIALKGFFKGPVLCAAAIEHMRFNSDEDS